MGFASMFVGDVFNCAIFGNPYFMCSYVHGFMGVHGFMVGGLWYKHPVSLIHEPINTHEHIPCPHETIHPLTHEHTPPCILKPNRLGSFAARV